jgi:hypothetical protein
VVGVSDAFDDRPARASTVYSLVAGATAVLVLLVGGSPSGVAVGLVALAVLGPGLAVGRRRLVDLGAATLLVAVVLAGIEGAGPATLLAASTAMVVAWDVGENAISVGQQLGRAADTRRAELGHAAATTTLGVTAGGIGFATFTVASDGQPVTAVAFMLVAILVLTVALRL